MVRISKRCLFHVYCHFQLNLAWKFLVEAVSRILIFPCHCLKFTTAPSEEVNIHDCVPSIISKRCNLGAKPTKTSPNKLVLLNEHLKTWKRNYKQAYTFNLTQW